MIVSFRHGYIHIKTKKTAGTSVEIALSPSCGPDDIVAPISPQDERLRIVGDQRVARNYAVVPENELLRHRYVLELNDRAARDLDAVGKRAGDLYNHVSAKVIKAKVPADFWTSAVKFVVERHPYEKAVSMAFYRLGKRKPDEKFAETLEATVHGGSYNDRPRYCIDGASIADVVLRQESLEPDLAKLAQRLGIAIAFPLPRAKGNYRRDRRPAAEILSPEQKEIIYNNTRETFDALGYQR